MLYNHPQRALRAMRATCASGILPGRHCSTSTCRLIHSINTCSTHTSTKGNHIYEPMVCMPALLRVAPSSTQASGLTQQQITFHEHHRRSISPSERYTLFHLTGSSIYVEGLGLPLILLPCATSPTTCI
jgi:hypothetical protein